MIPQQSVNMGDSIHYSSYQEYLQDAMSAATGELLERLLLVP